DERKLFLPEAYPSMLAYCTGAMQLSEDEAKKRIRVARTGRRCAGVFEALASGRVHLSGLVVLAKHLTPENVVDLLAAAEDQSREEIERIVAERFPKLDVPAHATPIAQGPAAEGSPATLRSPEKPVPPTAEGAPGPLQVHHKVSPLSAEAYAVQFTRS